MGWIDSNDAKGKWGTWLQVINELNRMEMNMTRMDKDTKGLRQLCSSMERIRHYLKGMDIEIVRMLGDEYREGMVADVEFEVDESIPAGVSRITMVKRPQVNYRGVMVQKALVTVAQNK